jgi:hypothetical protein
MAPEITVVILAKAGGNLSLREVEVEFGLDSQNDFQDIEFFNRIVDLGEGCAFISFEVDIGKDGTRGNVNPGENPIMKSALVPDEAALPLVFLLPGLR